MSSYLIINTRSLLSAALILLGTALVAGGCSADDEDLGIAVPDGNQLRLSLLAEPSTIDPHQASGGLVADHAVSKQLFRGLFAYEPELGLVPEIARELPTRKNGGISDDGLVYTIKLRDDVRWSDGQPISAADFEYSLKRLLNPATEAYSAGAFYDISGAEKYNSCFECSETQLDELRRDVGVTAVDATTLVIRLSSPRVTLPHLLANLAASPLRRDLIERHGVEWMAPGNLVSAGPFVLDEWNSELLVLAQNPHWWGKPVRLDTATIRFVADPADAFSLFLAGELDVVEIPPDLKPTVDADPKLVKQSIEQPSLFSSAYFLNHGKPPFDDELVRQAFSLAVDREAFSMEVEAGASLVGLSWIPRGMPGYDKDLGRQWRFDPEKARKLLAEAGYPDGEGLPSITYEYGRVGSNAAYAEFLRNQLLTNLGVAIQLQPLEIGAWRERFFAGELQISYLGWAAEYADPEDFLRELWTCQRYEAGECITFAGNNLVHYANPEFDRLMQLAAKETDAKRRLRYYGQAEKVLVGDAPAIFMTHGVRHILVKPYVGGAVHTPLDAMPMEFFLDRAYIKH